MVCYIFGEERMICLRLFYFLFIELFVEVDVFYVDSDGKIEWIEVLGVGMVYLNVLIMGGYDFKVYCGFVFGIGFECIVILKYKIDDIC